MPKMKTKRAAAKRFKVTGSGKIKKKKAFLRHLLTCKNAKKKRQLRGTSMVEAPGDQQRIKRFLPYAF